MNLLRKVVDPVLVVSFFFTGVTGILLLLHVHSFLVKELHEISSLLFVAAGLLHLGFNLKQLAAHLRQRAGLIALCLVLFLLSGIALHLSGEGDRHPRRGPEVSDPAPP